MWYSINNNNDHSDLDNRSDEELVPISIEDIEKNPRQQPAAQSTETDNTTEELLPARNAVGEPNGYAWTEITDEFFESVKGTFIPLTRRPFLILCRSGSASVRMKQTSMLMFTELQLGELVHHQKLFGLFEAMSAIEMMDPKMDAGMVCNKDPAGPLTFDIAVAVSTADIKSKNSLNLSVQLSVKFIELSEQ